MERKPGIQTVSLNVKTERMVVQHMALPHPCFRRGMPSSTSSYKGEEKDGFSFPVPLLCKEGQGEVESEI